MLSLKQIRALTAAALLAMYSIAPTVAFAQAAPTQSVENTATAKETVDNPYGLDALWKGGDIVAKGTLTILVLMSAGSWYVIFTKLYEQSKLGRQAKKANASFWSAGEV